MKSSSHGLKQYVVYNATLVDRIVPGFPRKDIDNIKTKLDFDDNLVVQGEAFHLWVIEHRNRLPKNFLQTRRG